MHGATLKWIKIFLMNRTQKVVVNGGGALSDNYIALVWLRLLVLNPLQI